jgi:hypothetical protein
MKIVNEMLARGRHAVALLAESAEDDAALQAFFAIVTRHRVVDAHLGQSAGDEWRTLRLEERE